MLAAGERRVSCQTQKFSVASPKFLQSSADHKIFHTAILGSHGSYIHLACEDAWEYIRGGRYTKLSFPALSAQFGHRFAHRLATAASADPSLAVDSDLGHAEASEQLACRLDVPDVSASLYDTNPQGQSRGQYAFDP